MKSTLYLNLNKDNQAAWNDFLNADERYVNSDSYRSLLEIILKDNEYPEERINILNTIKSSMKDILNDSTINYSKIPRKDISHNRRVHHNIELILFPTEADIVDNKIHMIYDLNKDDIFILLCSIYLHDYGKAQFRLILPHIRNSNVALYEKIKETTHAIDLTGLDYGEIEKYHSYNLYELLNVLLQNSEEDECIRKFNDNYSNQPLLDRYIRQISDPSSDDPQCVLFYNLWKLREYERTDGRQECILSNINDVCCSHKPYHLSIMNSNNKLEEIEEDHFNEIDNKLKLVAALLRIGDNLDFTRERIEQNAMENYMRNWLSENDQENVPKSYLNLFGIWIKFILVDGLTVRHVDKKKKNNERYLQLEIIIRYKRFTNWQKHFSTIRSMVEKDFKATNYLKSLNTENVKICLLYELVSNRHKSYKIENNLGLEHGIRKQLDIWFKKAKKVVEHNGNIYRLISLKDMPDNPLKFSPLPFDIQLPANRNLLYLITYIKNSTRVSTQGIANALGIQEFNSLHHQKDTITKGKVLKFDGDAQIRISDKMDGPVTNLMAEYRAQPSLIRQKVQEYDELGYLLPFSLKQADNIPTGITGLDCVLDPYGKENVEDSGIRQSRNLLIVGNPGTGKTTLLIQILHYNLHYRQRNVLMLTLEENFPVVTKTFEDNFGWDVPPIESLQIPDNGNAMTVISEIQAKIEKHNADLIALDGLSKLINMNGNDYRNEIATLFRTLQMKGITGLFSIESSAASVSGIDYQADGLIHLYMKPWSRYLEIEKLRGQAYVPGYHAFEIIDLDYILGETEKENCSLDDIPFEPGINVYPNEQYHAIVTNMHTSTTLEEKPKYIPTGIEKLEDLLPGEPTGGYREGNSILVMGSPGSGKTLFGLHFLLGEFKYNEELEKREYHENNVLWLSFEGPKRSLERGVSSFDPSAGYEKLIHSDSFIFKFFPPALISPEKVMFFIIEMVKSKNISRIVVDSVSEIEPAFDKPVRFRQYMTTLIHVLSIHGVTTMFLYRIPGFFRSTKESESDISTLVDTIISIKTFDMKNEIRRGLFVLKSRGREHRSQLQTMEIDPREGITVSYKGWEMEGLLSGDTGNIREPSIFLKLFYENPAEERINKQIIREFQRRYPDKARFTQVRKPAIYSEFWSFRGDYGAGHSNIRVVSISNYMIEAFRELDRLHDLNDFFPEKLKEKIEEEHTWKRYRTERGTYDSIPVYTDIGFCVVRTDLINQLDQDIKTSFLEQFFRPGIKNDSTSFRNKSISWNDISIITKEGKYQEEFKEGTAKLPYVFALPHLVNNQAEFMAFFCEILWSIGGDIYHFPIFGEEENKRHMSFYKEQIFLNKQIWKDFIDIIQLSLNSSSESQPALYSISKIRKKVEGLSEFFFKYYPNEKILERQEKDDIAFLNFFISVIQKHIINNSFESKFSDNADIITIDNKYGIQTLEFIYDLVYESGGTVPNPFYGDFCQNSIFCRKWYSQIEDLKSSLNRDENKSTENKIIKLNIDGKEIDLTELVKNLDEEEGQECEESDIHLEIIALPYFEDKTNYKKSCTAEIVWNLGVIKEALSPEIGWILIDTLTSKEWVQKRSRSKRGLPHRNEEMKLVEKYDPDVYAIWNNIVEFKKEKDQIYHEKNMLVKNELTTDSFREHLKKIFKGKYNVRDIGDILHYIGQLSDNEDYIQILKDECKNNGLDYSTVSKTKVSELTDYENELLLRSKVQASRPFFHRVESILYHEITKLFSPKGRKYWYTKLVGESIDKNDDEINKKLKELRKKEKEGGSESPKLIYEAMKQMKMKLIFDLITSAPKEIQKIWLNNNIKENDAECAEHVPS